MASVCKDSGYVDNWQRGKTVSECNLHMLETEDCSDVLFRVGSEKQMVRAHRYVLVSRSCVFHAMFCGPLAEKGEVTIPDIETQIFKDFLRYLYTDRVNITADNVSGLLYTARKYAVDFLQNQCCAFLEKSLTEETVCQILEQCHVYGEVDLEQKSMKILTEAGEKVIGSPGFLDLCSSCLERFLKSDDLKLKEEDIFESSLTWGKEKCKKDGTSSTPENLRHALGQMIYEIRFSNMSLDYLVKVVGPSLLLNAEERILIMDHIVDPERKIAPFKSGQRNGLTAAQVQKDVHRFQNVTWDWNSSGGYDAIAFMASKNIQLLGCQMYGPYGRSDSNYKVNILVYDDQDRLIAEPVPSTEIKLKGLEELNDIKFLHPIDVVADRYYTVYVSMTGVNTYYGKNGLKSVCASDVNFSFKNSPKSKPGWTSTATGQIPGLLFRCV